MATRTHLGRYFTMAVAAVIAVAVTASDSFATSCDTTVVVTTSTPGVSNGKFTLTSNYTTSNDNSPCFDMRSGLDLDLDGHSITCTDASCFAAVTCDTSGSRIRSSESADGAHIDISGPFVTGVSECTDIEDLFVDGSATAVSSTRADLIASNVIHTCSDVCIEATMQSSTDRIHDNLIKPYGGDGISIVGKSTSQGPRVDHNLIMKCEVGIYNNDTTYVRIEDNIIADCEAPNDPFDIDSTNKTLTNNLCEADALCTNEYGDPPPVGSILD
jgi:hypothetical protein